MQLVECGDCHKQISDEAHSCPNCGKPMRNRFRVVKPLFLLLLALFCVVVPLAGLAFLYLSRSMLRNVRTSVKGVGEDLLKRI